MPVLPFYTQSIAPRGCINRCVACFRSVYLLRTETGLRQYGIGCPFQRTGSPDAEVREPADNAEGKRVRCVRNHSAFKARGKQLAMA